MKGIDRRLEALFGLLRQHARGENQAVYAVRFEPVGEADPGLGPPTQMAVLTRGSAPPEPPGAPMAPERQAARPHRAELSRAELHR